MIVSDKYKIEIDKADFSLYHKQYKEVCTRVTKNGKISLTKTGKFTLQWVHVGYYSHPWEALKKIIWLESGNSFNELNTLTDLVKRMGYLEKMVNAWELETKPAATQLYKNRPIRRNF